MTLPPARSATDGPSLQGVTRSRSTGEIAVDRVIPDPDQPRKHFDAVELTNLAADMKARGQLQAIRVRWSENHHSWIITAGERRWRAIKEAGLDSIRCEFIREQLSENEIRSEQLVENLLRQDLTIIEEAKAYQALIALNGWNNKQVAAYLHISQAKVSKALSLLKLPEDVQQKVATGTLPAKTAYELTKLKDKQTQRKLIEHVQADKLTAGSVSSSIQQKQTTATRKRRTTNETFRASNGLKVVASSKRYLGDDGLLESFLELAEIVRKRMRDHKQAA